MKKTLLAGLIAALLSLPAAAFQAFEIKDIRVEGIQRTEAGTVFSYLPVKVGDTLTEEKAAQAVKALFGTGFFKDVRLEIDGQVLVVVIEERPAIASLQFTGLKAFKPEDLRKGLREVGLAESRIFDRALVERAEQELKRQYLSQGHYAVDVTTTVTPLERNRVGINFAVTEGEIAKIKQINLIGAAAFTEADLLDLFVLRTPGWLTWYTKNDQYSKQKLTGDLETLRSFYLDRGYIDFNIDSTQVAITPDKQDIYITINVTEGEKFSVSGVKLAGELLLPEEELRKLVKIKPGEVFSREKINETTKAISERLGNEGYAFANVNAAPEFDKAKREVAFTLFIDPGRRVYVRRINVVGNARTRDAVILREMRQMESSWYDGDKITRSRARVDRLGYFDEVTVETPAVAGTTDQVDVELKVKEKPTGNLMLGAGFSSSEKFVLSGSVEQQNLFGSGRHVGVGLSTSKSNKVYSLSHTDPYYTTDGLSRGFDLYYRATDTASLAVGAFAADSLGGGIRFSVPVSDDDRVQLGAAYDVTKLKLSQSSPLRFREYVAANTDKLRSLLLSSGWSSDGRDSHIYPMDGSLRRLNLEVAGPTSTVPHYRATTQYQTFYPLTRKVALMLNGEAGLARSFSSKAVPFYRNLYAGGIGSVRGFENGTLGPRDVNGEVLGGTTRAVANAELLAPVPGLGLDKSMRMSAFLDAGNVWGYGRSWTTDSVRYSAGVALSWNSPMGPLKFSFAKPLNSRNEDKLQSLQFQLGSTF